MSRSEEKGPRDAARLAVDVYKAFSGSRDFGFKDQITRSALSIASNIAEGYERDSNNEFIRFLKIAKGSCGELRTQLYVALEIGYPGDDEALPSRLANPVPT